jgi:hypothetical protein
MAEMTREKWLEMEIEKDKMRDEIEQAYRAGFEWGLDDKVKEELDRTREEREQMLGELIAERLREEFEDDLDFWINQELERKGK